MHRLEIEQSAFKNPGASYRLAPFWFWNHEIKDDEVIWQIREMHRQGVGGFIIHGRCGLITQYMSNEWLNLCETAIREAESLGMKVYLYDDLDFPSGSAAGRVGEDPEMRGSAIRVTLQQEIEGGTLLDTEIDTRDELLAVLAVPIVGGNCVTDPSGILDLTDHLTENRISWNAPDGKWLVMAFAREVWFGGFNTYLGDYLNPDAMRRFVELTHERYTQRFGDYFGSTVVGIFTDEPAVNYFEPGLPWSKGLAGEFAADNGKDLIPNLPGLFLDAGPESWKLRCDFWGTVGRIYSENFYGRIGEFCKEHNLCSIGHLSSDGELFLQARRQVDYFKCARHMDFGGADCLFTVTWPAVAEEQGSDFDWNDVNNLLALKLASSSAHLYGKPRTMSEAFGVAGQWGIDLRTLKRLTDWHIALGINLIMPHAFYYSISGFRRWESPPGESYQSSFWPYYRTYADYTGRLCSLFSGGKHCAEIAVLYPIKSMWTTNLSADTPDDIAKSVIAGLTEVTRELVRSHNDFDIIPEELVVEAGGADCLEIVTPDGTLAHAFKVLVIPPCTTLDSATYAGVSKFYEQGGTIILLGDLPDSSTEIGEDMSSQDIFKNIFGDQFSAANQNGGRAIWLPEVGFGDDLQRRLVKALEPHVQPQALILEDGNSVGDIICLKQTKAGADFYFLANTSEDCAFSTKVHLGTSGKPSLWNALTGDATEIADHRRESGRTVVDLYFEPTQSYVICVEPEENKIEVAQTSIARHVAVLPDAWEFSTAKPNVLPLTQWQMNMHAEPITLNIAGAPRCDLAKGWHVYKTSFHSNTEIGKARLVFPEVVGEHCIRILNLPFTVKVEVNGTEITDFEQGSYLDRLMKEAEIGHLLRVGTNELTITTKVELYDGGCLNHPVLLVGDFSLVSQENGLHLAEPVKDKVRGSWTEFGYPYYSGTGIYSNDVLLPEIEANELYFLRFESVGDLAEVTVNGQTAGVAAWEPYEVDITSHINPGMNRFEIKVANSLQNLLVLSPKASGILGKVEVIARK